MSKSLKIVLFTDGVFPYVVGGMQRHSAELAKAMAAAGAEVHVFHFIPNGNTAPRPQELFKQTPNLFFHEVPFPEGAKFPGHYVRKSYLYSKALYTQLEKSGIKPDFVYAQGFTGWYYIKKRKRNKKLAPIGVNLHGLNMFQRAFGIKQQMEHRMMRYPARRCLRGADVIFSLGGKLTDISRAQRPSGGLAEIPVGIDPSWIVEETPVHKPVFSFVFVGRNDKIKALPVLVQAATHLYKTRTDFKLHLVGVSNVPTTLPADVLICHGTVTAENELQKIYDEADVLVCPSYSEGMPVVILEAMSRGLSVIASRTGAVEKLVLPSSGWLISPASANELVSAMQQAMWLPKGALTNKKTTSVQHVKTGFTWPRVAQLTLTEIRKHVKLI